MSAPTRVLFVCLGNICRSPMAHGLFAHFARERGLADRFEVDSAGTAAYHAGEPPDERTLAVLAAHGVALDHRARQVGPSDFERFDVIVAMDAANLHTLRTRCPEPRRDRLFLALEPVGGGDVPDPYYGGSEGFALVFDQLGRALHAWIDRLTR